MTEIWKDIPGYEGRYQASNLGRIKSLPNKRRFTELIMRQRPHIKTGYLQVGLTSHDGKRWIQRLHWVAPLICLTFHGPAPVDTECCHNDGVKTNNASGNLRWDTKIGNQADRVTHGTHNIGSQNPAARLTEETARQVKAKLAAGVSVQSLAEEYDVAIPTIKNIKNGYSWRHV